MAHEVMTTPVWLSLPRVAQPAPAVRLLLVRVEVVVAVATDSQDIGLGEALGRDDRTAPGPGQRLVDIDGATSAAGRPGLALGAPLQYGYNELATLTRQGPSLGGDRSDPLAPGRRARPTQRRATVQRCRGHSVTMTWAATLHPVGTLAATSATKAANRISFPWK